MPDELAALLKRAKGLLAVGDITSARLLLERAADAQEAEAALMLAGTYDPQVLGDAGHAQHHAGSGDGAGLVPEGGPARLGRRQAAASKSRTRHLQSSITDARITTTTHHSENHAGDNMRRLFGMAFFAMTMACGLDGPRGRRNRTDPAKVSESLKAIFQFGSVATKQA